MGPINNLHKTFPPEIKLSPLPDNISLAPRQTLLHREVRYLIRAKNQLAKEFNNHSWKVYYGGNDVSSYFEISPQSTIDETIVESKSEVRLPYILENEKAPDLLVVWQMQGQTQAFKWPTSSCSVFFQETTGKQNNLRSMGQFQEKAEIFSRLERAAKENNINPNFFAGVLAAVSQLSSAKISENKKIGLAQIPFMEAILISKDKAHWPKSKRIENSPSFLLQLLLKFSLIDPETDWRLNIEKSLLAGAEYIKYINNYWADSEYKELIKDSPETYNKIVAASYILGPSAVKDLYQVYGEKFDNLKSLSETREVINTIFSYCSEFSNDKSEIVARVTP